METVAVPAVVLVAIGFAACWLEISQLKKRQARLREDLARLGQTVNVLTVAFNNVTSKSERMPVINKSRVRLLPPVTAPSARLIERWPTTSNDSDDSR